MEILDSRRLTGASLLTDSVGVQLDLRLAESEVAGEVQAALEARLEPVLDELGWDVQFWRRVIPGQLSIAMSAPLDALYSAVEVMDWAAGGLVDPDKTEAVAEAVPRLRALVEAERSTRLLDLEQEARTRGLNFCGDDEWTTLGMGARGITFPTEELPGVSEVNWEGLADIPCAMVTGTNGKTTTVRLLVAMARAAGFLPGASSTDWIQVGEEMLDRDDWSGPGGARAVLKDPRVEVAILETARGGMLRRGLAIPRCDVALITNVSEDHLGERGILTLEHLREVKWIVTRAADRLVLNFDDVGLRKAGEGCEEPPVWFSLGGESALEDHLRDGGRAAVLEGDALVWCEGEKRSVLARCAEVPITIDGAARHNVANVLGAVATAKLLGFDEASIRSALVSFTSDAQSNPGRLNAFERGGVRALVDFAHNPGGLRAILEMAQAMPHGRLLVLVGQAGDRDDDAIRELAEVTARAEPDCVVVKEMDEHARGRAEGEVGALICKTLRELGLEESALIRVPTELEAVARAIDWSRPGDLLVLLSHAERDAVLQALEAWSQG